MKTGTLYIVATPIGNLKDITLRALETLKEVDFVACEDTRITSKLLNHYSIKKPLISYHQHSKLARIDKIIEHLEAGKNIALVTDAGTPGISDPGNKIIEHITCNMENETGKIQVVPIPGPSAMGAITSVAGIDMQKFIFLGFPPHKKGRETFLFKLESFVEDGMPVVCFESCHRIIKFLKSLKKLRVIVGRELTKLFEEILRGESEEVAKYLEDNKEKLKGEFVIIVYKKLK